MKNKSVAIVCQNFYPEMVSTGLLITEMATELRKRGWDITVYCSKPVNKDIIEQKIPREINYKGITIKRMPSIGSKQSNTLMRLLMNLTYLLSTIKALISDKDQYNGIFVTTNPAFIGLAGWFMAIFFGKKYLQLVHDVYPDIAIQFGAIKENSLLANIWHKITKIILNKASVIIVIGEDMKSILKQKLNGDAKDKIKLITNWSDKNNVRPINDEDNNFRKEHDLKDKIVIQYSGKMGRTHPLEKIVEAAEVLQKESNLLFLMIGEGPKKNKLVKMTEEKELENVKFLPYQPHEDLSQVFSAADLSIVCLGSEWTGLSVPSKTYGIMASKTAILGLVDENSEIGMTVKRHNCGVIMENPSFKEIASKLKALTKEPDELKKMGENGLNAFLEYYTLQRAGDQYNKILNETFNTNCNQSIKIEAHRGIRVK